jgi:FlaA1/EpsC-like NDP-sugar epimerase
VLKATHTTRKIFFLVADIVIIFLSTYLAYGLRFDFAIPEPFYDSLLLSGFVLVVVRTGLFYTFRIYNISWRHFGFKDTINFVSIISFSTLLLVFLAYLLQGSSYVIPRSIIPIEFFISLFLILSLRVSKRLYLEKKRTNIEGKSTVIVADVDKANTILRTIESFGSGYFPVGVINDTHQNIKINGIEVYDWKQFSRLKKGCEVAIVDGMTSLREDAWQKVRSGLTTVEEALRVTGEA